MSEVERVRLSRNLWPNAKGEWVRAEEYDALARERDELVNARSDQMQAIVATQQAREQAENQLEALRGKERGRVLREIRALTPHEMPCNCGAYGSADLARHSEACPRGIVHHMLAALAPDQREEN